MPSRLRAFWPGLILLAACHTPPALDYGRGLDVPYVQTEPAVVRKMLELAAVQRNELVIDLGCGDGRIPIAAASAFGARAIGYDLDPARIADAIANARQAGVEARTRFVRQDLFNAPIGQANVVTLFLFPAVLERLRPRLRSELGPGARIVSHSFQIRTWKPEKVLRFEGRTLYLYRLPQSLPPLASGPAVPAA
jgi:SAM-dependent methyltransferase